MSRIVSRQVRIAQVAGVAAGGLIVYASAGLKGTITVYRLDEQGKQGQPFYAELKPYTTGEGKAVAAAVFSPLPPANYKVIEPGYSTIGRNVTVFPGEVAEVDYR
jgi:hypothetical protein